MRTAIAIPARFASTRFPGKPLAKIGGETMLQRVVDCAKQAAKEIKDADVFVTTDDKRIAAHAKEIDVPCIMTAANIATGSDRVLAAVRQLDEQPDFIVNLQGDAPFTPPQIITAMVKIYKDMPHLEVITPVHQLNWFDLDRLRRAKETAPFSGTTVLIDQTGRAIWFSKNIIPAIRDEDALREHKDLSPVFQHIGLYGFKSSVLETFCSLPQSMYEQLEGLEQLRFLENNISVQTVEVEIAQGRIQPGIDTPADLERAEKMLGERAEAL